MTIDPPSTRSGRIYYENLNRTDKEAMLIKEFVQKCEENPESEWDNYFEEFRHKLNLSKDEFEYKLWIWFGNDPSEFSEF